MRQSALTLIAPIRDNEVEPLRRVLEKQDAALKQALGDIGTIHYARWVIIEASGPYRAQLAFDSNFDGAVNAHVDDLVRALGNLLDEIYAHCEDYSSGAKSSYLL